MPHGVSIWGGGGTATVVNLSEDTVYVLANKPWTYKAIGKVKFDAVVKKNSGTISGGGCFAAGTKIMVAPNVYKNIEDIIVNDSIISYNVLFNSYEQSKVLTCNTYDNKQVYEIILDNNKKLYTSDCHPFLGADNVWYAIDTDMALSQHQVIANKLSPGTIIKQYNNTAIVQAINKTNRIETLYDIGVSNISHTYIANDCIVHNIMEFVHFDKS